MPDVDALETRAREAEAAGLAVAGVTKSGGASASAGIGGLVLVTSHGFHGATIASRHGIAMTAIAGDGTGMERDYDFSSTLHASRPRKRASDRTPRRRTRRQAPQSAQGRHASRTGRVRFQDLRFAGRASRQRRQRQRRSPARRVSCAKNSAQKIFASGIDIIDDPLRPRGLRSRPFDAEGIAGAPAQAGRRTACLRRWILD